MVGESSQRAQQILGEGKKKKGHKSNDTILSNDGQSKSILMKEARDDSYEWLPIQNSKVTYSRFADLYIF